MFWRTLRWEYDAIDFDDEWKDLIDEIAKGDVTGKPARGAERKWDNRRIVDVEYGLHAERLIEHLSKQFGDRFDFAAHTHHSSRSWYSILARTKSKRAPLKRDRKKITAAARAILRDVEAKYPKGRPQHTGFWASLFG